MKKLLFSLFALTVLFTSCGKEDTPEDLTVSNPAVLAKDYAGTCTVKVTSINRDQVENSTDVTIKTTTNANELFLFSTSEFGVNTGSTQGLLKNFKYKSSARDMIIFDMGGLSVTANGEGIPDYITDWFSRDYNISSITLNLSNAVADYTVASKTLAFKYSGKLVLKAKTSDDKDVSPDPSYDIQYTYSVVQK